jgi:hypothetical protein
MVLNDDKVLGLLLLHPSGIVMPLMALPVTTMVASAASMTALSPLTAQAKTTEACAMMLKRFRAVAMPTTM